MILVAMPERHEVLTFTRDFRKRFPPGSQITNIECHHSSYQLPIPPSHFPLTISKVGSKGKKTFIKFTNGMAFLVSYGMTASWRLKKSADTKYTFVFSGGEKYYWQTVRRLHCEKIEYLTHETIQERLDELGLDIYLARPSDEEILARFL